MRAVHSQSGGCTYAMTRCLICRVTDTRKLKIDQLVGCELGVTRTSRSTTQMVHGRSNGKVHIG